LERLLELLSQLLLLYLLLLLQQLLLQLGWLLGHRNADRQYQHEQDGNCGVLCHGSASSGSGSTFLQRDVRSRGRLAPFLRLL
jgi:hypothetical protein